MTEKKKWIKSRNRLYSRRNITEDVNSLYFESGARVSSHIAYCKPNDTNEEMTYYLIYVAARPRPFAAFNAAEYELCESEVEIVL